jgi:hypothetical protein
MPDWKHLRWHLCLLLLGVAFISLVLCLESRHLSEGDHSDVRGLPHSSSDPGTIRGQAGSGRPAPIDSGDSMVERKMVAPASGAMGGARERCASGESPGSPDTHSVKVEGYPVKRISPGLGQTGGGALSGNPTGTRSVQSSTMSAPVVPALAPSAVRDVNPGGTLATPSGDKVADNGAVTGGAVTGGAVTGGAVAGGVVAGGVVAGGVVAGGVVAGGVVAGGAVTESLGMSGSPSETPASSVSPIPPTASAGSTDPASQNDGAGKAAVVRQATAEELYRTKYGWAVYGEFIRRRTIDQYNGIAPTDAGGPPLD